MNSEEFIKCFSEKMKYNDIDATGLVASIADILSENLQDGKSVSLSGFGTFGVEKEMERVLVNTSTGQRMLVPPRLVVDFKPLVSVEEIIYHVKKQV